MNSCSFRSNFGINGDGNLRRCDSIASTARILRELTRNGRISHADLSARVGLSPTACARRQKALEDPASSPATRRCSASTALGFGTTVIVRITLDSQAEEALDIFEKAVVACPSVVRCFLMSGSDDYIIAVNARSIADFERIHRTELACLPHVARVQSSFALREVINRAVPPAALAQGSRARTHSARSVQEAEDPEQQNNRQRNADQPEKSTLQHRRSPRAPDRRADQRRPAASSAPSRNRSMLQTYFLGRAAEKTWKHAATFGGNRRPL